MIAAVIERCAGIDVGKKVLAVCIMTGAADAGRWCLRPACSVASLEEPPDFNLAPSLQSVQMLSVRDVV
jgi:hypothetical protein